VVGDDAAAKRPPLGLLRELCEALRERSAGARVAGAFRDVRASGICARRFRACALKSIPVLRKTECLSESVDGALPGIASLQPRPGLGLMKQRPELREQVGSPGTRTVERLDPLQSLEHRSCLVHESNGSPEALEDG
jgi:hypothetical protein